jgi:asparaginyl-tRNA synthetase
MTDPVTTLASMIPGTSVPEPETPGTSVPEPWAPTTYRPTSTLHDIYSAYQQDPGLIANRFTKFYGWVRRIRVGGGGSLIFIDLYDGTRVGAMMCIASPDYYQGTNFVATNSGLSLSDELTDCENFKILSFEQLARSEYLSDGCAVVVDGQIVLSPSNTSQLFELQVHRVRVIGGVVDPATYSIQKSTERQIVSLRKLPFMRFRSQVTQSIFRICSKLELAIHMWMDQEHVEKIDPNIITMSDCEGAGETFTVSPAIFSKDAEGNDIQVGLTVSSQLPLEAAITGFRAVYTVQKSFRAEKSDTAKHLAEFVHVEFEQAFTTLPDLMEWTERFVKWIINWACMKCADDLDFLESKFAPQDVKASRKLLTEWLKYRFVRIKHCHAIKLIRELVTGKTMLPDDNGKMKRVKVTQIPGPEEDLGSEHEKLLVRYFGWIAVPEEERESKLKTGYVFDAFVFVTHWPLKVKSFYMKQCPDNSGECESFDLLAPRVGELFGGSMREWRFQVLCDEMKRRAMDPGPLEWFLDLRKSGSMPHGGWGMGFARLCMLVTGVPSVRDVVPFPVYYTHCPY